MLVWIASYPHSGNTLVRMALKALYGVHTHSIHGDANMRDLGIAEEIGHADLPAGGVESLARAPGVHLVKTHERMPPDDCPCLYVVRDGRDAMISYAHYQEDVEGLGGTFDQRLAKLIIGESPRGCWSDHVRSWLDRSGAIALIRYDKLVAHPLETVAEAVAQLELPLDAQDEGAVPSFADLHVAAPAFFRSGQTGHWRDEMSPAMERLFWQWNADGMARAGYPSSKPPGDESAECAAEMEALQSWLLRDLRRELEDARCGMRKMNSDLQAVRDSASWRLTRPLRWLKGRLLRRG